MARFIIHYQNEPDKEFDLTALSLVIAGRELDNNLILGDPRVSRKQFLVDHREELYTIVNLSSTQRTRVNGHMSDRIELNDGDLIEVGETRLIFLQEVVEPPTAPPETPRREQNDLTPEIAVNADGIEDSVEFSNDMERIVDNTLATSNPERTMIHQVISAAKGDSTAAKLRSRVHMLQAIGREMVKQLDLDKLLELILEKIFEVLQVENGLILLVDQENRRLTPRAVRLKKGKAKKGSPMRVSQTLIKQVFSKQIGVLSGDTQSDSNLSGQQSIMGFGIRSVMCVPLALQGEVLGVIHIDSETAGDPFSEQDLDLLTALGNQAALCVHNAQLHDQIVEETTRRANLERYFSPTIARKMAEQDIQIDLGGRNVEVTVLYSDIRHFTTISERVEPDELVRFLNQYFSAMADIVFEYQGTFDKFIGDALVAVFGSPIPDEAASLNATRCAERMLQRLQKMSFSVGPVMIGIGLHRGKVIHGNIGSEKVMQYTVIGDAVNTAARLSDVADMNQIIMSKDIYEDVRAVLETRSLGAVRLRGKSEPIETYELVWSP